MADSRAVLTVLGADRVGIVASVCVALATHNVNIEDIRMALMGELFTMIALVDVGRMSTSFAELQAALDACAQELGVQVMIQRENIFRSMHRI